MKKILFAAAAATFLFASCAKDGANNGTANNGKTGTITVTLKGSDVTRAVSGDNGVTVTAENASVFLVQGSMLTEHKVHLDMSIKNTHTFEDVSTEVSAVYVISNAGDLVAGADKITSWNDLLTRKHTLTQNASDKLILQGNAAITFTNEGAAGEQKLVARPTVKLRPLAARIDVTVKKGPDIVLTDGAANRLTIEKLALLYSAKENHLINQSGVLGGDGSEWRNAPEPGATVTYPYYYSGLDHIYYQNVWLAAGNTELYPSGYGALSVSFANNNDAFAQQTFYAYPGAGAHGRHTIVTLSAKWKNEEDEVEDTFFSAHFKGMDTYGGLLPVVENGRFYTINIVLNGDYTQGESGGTPDPEDEDEYGDVIIELGDGEWIVVVPEIDVPFN